jgi:LuxR family maltose regulon positive regulatory protein
MDFDGCAKIYEYIMKHFHGDKTCEAFVHANLFFDVNWEFRNITILSLEQIEQLPLHKVTKAYVLVKEAYFLFVADKVLDAMKYLDMAEQIYKETHNIYIESFVLAEKTQILEEYGQFKQALRLYGEMKKCIDEVPTMKTSYYIGIAGLHIRQMRLLEAKEELDLAKEAMGKGFATINSAYLYTLAEWCYISGQPLETEKIILSLAQDNLYQSVFFSARLLRYPVYRGKNQKLAESFLHNYDHTEELLKNMDTDLLCAGIVYELVDQQKGIKMVDTLMTRARKVHNMVKIVECSLMKARFLFEQGTDETKLLNLVAEAAAYACNNEIAVPFWFEKEAVIKIFAKYRCELEERLSQKELAYVQWAISGGQTMETNSCTMNQEQLTEREIEVLEEIEHGNSNKIAAEHLCISLATVKTHLINIYSKLGVNNRVAAINKYKNMKQ